MEGFLCVKTLILSGQGYMPGDLIPKEKVLPSRVRTLIREKYITPANDPAGDKSAASRQKKRAEKDAAPDGDAG